MPRGQSDSPHSRRSSNRTDHDDRIHAHRDLRLRHELEAPAVVLPGLYLEDPCEGWTPAQIARTSPGGLRRTRRWIFLCFSTGMRVREG
jgi:hypothetical protein